MSVPKALTAEQKREFVYEYVAQPFGSRSTFLLERGVTKNQIRQWRSQVFAGTLELGLVPRGGTIVSVEESAALARLLKEKQALQEQLDRQQAEHEKVLAAKDAELDVQRRAVDALGKAIEILHHADAGKNSRTDRVEHEQP